MAPEIPSHRCHDCDETFPDPLTRNVESPQKYPMPLPREWGKQELPGDVPWLCGPCDGKRRERFGRGRVE